MSNQKKSLLTLAALVTSILMASNAIAADVSITKAASDQAKVLIYRGNSHYYAPARTDHLYVNGNHIANLNKEQYTEFCLSPNTHILGSHLEDSLIYNSKNRKDLTVKFEAGSTYVFRANDDEFGGGQLVLMDLLNGQRDLSSRTFTAYNGSKYDKSINTSDIQPCKPYVAAPVYIAPVPLPMPVQVQAPAPQSVTFNLAADGVFEFDRSSMKDLKQEGKNKLDNIIETLNKNNAKVDSMVVTGHADRLGKADYNQHLSQSRAETIKMYLIQNNVKADNITAVGKGSNEPITTCTQKNRKELIDCLSNNRRITIDIKGIMKQPS
jgi:outer membrane protein OmpA-like peptidoglycan-associated protein